MKPTKDPRFTVTDNALAKDAKHFKEHGDKLAELRAKEIDEGLTKAIKPLLRKTHRNRFIKIIKMYRETADASDIDTLGKRADKLQELKKMLDNYNIQIIIQPHGKNIEGWRLMKHFVQQHGKTIAGPI